MSFVDIHQHIVYGMDDGPQTFEESVDMMRAACRDGITTIIATPHATPGEEEFRLSVFMNRLRELNDYCQLYALALQILPGAEIYYTSSTLRVLQEGRIPTLAGTWHVLVEFSPDVSYEELFDAVRVLSNEGFIPVVAHIERYRCLVQKPARVRMLKDAMSVKFQVNCGALIRRKSFSLQRFLRQVFGTGLIDFLATDAHNTGSRKASMTEGYHAIEDLYGQAFADGITQLRQIDMLRDC